MNLTRTEAIRLIETVTDRDDPYWERVCERVGLVDENTNDIPTIHDVMAALGVSRTEYEAACGLPKSE